MNRTRDIVLVIGGTLLLIALLGVWVGYKNGDISFTREQGIAEHEFPRSLTTKDVTSEEHPTMNSTTNPTVTLQTSKGDIVIELYQDLMPVTAGNFMKLAQEGFYDNTKFHRVINGFMIQGGDPNSKGSDTATYGRGGPGYTIADEHVADPKLSNVRGTIAMANSGPQSGGSQFFINLVDNTGLDFDKQPLSSKHPVFGRVVAGMEVVDLIATVPTNERDIPLEPVVVRSVVVE